MNLRDYLLRRLLTPEQLAVTLAMDRPDRWQPDQPLTEDEMKNWAAFLASPLGLKIDTAMVNFCQQEAQRALFATAENLPKQVGVALGVRAGWEMAKTLSRLGAAESAQSEPTATAPATLAHLSP